MNHWRDYGLPPMRLESHFGDRVVRCFSRRPQSFHAMFEAALAAHGEREAMVFEGRRWSYRALDADVAQVTAGLAARGIARGERVAMLLGNLPEYLITLYALQRLGAVAVPVSVREQRPGLEYIFRHCGARLVVYEAPLADRLPDAAACPTLEWHVAVGPEFEALKRHGAIAQAQAVDEEDTALILYTSGTTGRPKGAMLTHFNIVHSAMHFECCMRLNCEDRSALAVPASHVTGTVAIIATMLRVGGAVVVMREFKAARYVREAAAERVTQTILLQPEFGLHDLSAWRVGGYGGAPMPLATIDALAQQLPNLVLTNAYGATESTSPATLMPVGATRAHADTVGVTVPCGEIAVMDEDGAEVPRGEPGELWLGGPMVVKGYWNDPEATARGFTGGFWHSGDLGSIDAGGHVRIFDRKKDMLNRGGYKIYSVEVEHVLMEIPGVIEAAVVGKPCPVLGERVHAFVSAPGASAVTMEAVRAFCAARLADYKVPETVTVLDAPLPRNANGKLLKRVLREQAAAHP